MSSNTPKVDESGNALHCTCAFARRSRNNHGVEFCAHIQGLMASRRDELNDLTLPHLIVLGYTPAPDFQPHALTFSISAFKSSGMRDVSLGGEYIGQIAPDACRLNVVELATPYLVEWYYAHPCPRCRITLPDSMLDTDEGIATVVRLAAESHGEPRRLCRECANLVPKI